MTLRELLAGVEHTNTGPVLDCEISAITGDSRQVERGSVFFCIPGLRHDGHDHAEGALRDGAEAVVCQRDLGLGDRQVLVADSRHAYGVCCGNFFGNPAGRLKLIGVTGTNGKTTITYLVKQILEQAGKRVGLIGTIHNEIGDMELPSKYTTPDPIQLHTMLARMLEAGCEYVVMEVSSHALEQDRVAGMRFACAAFTNLTQDHLDYHGDMESYYRAKKKLFDLCGTAVLNFDDPYGQRLLAECGCQTLSYSVKCDGADYTARDIKFSAAGCRFALLASAKLARVKFCMPGYFSVSNALAAAASCLAVGIDFDTVVEGLGACTGVSGRLEVLDTGTDYTVIRDYAHSPDGLQKVLETLKEIKTGRLVCLFGCAGNRDRTKRAKMAAIAASLADFCILTSDNPRDEDPERIVQDAMPGFEGHDTPHEVIVDRYAAIQWALEHAQPDDILLLAGKGHEDYQVLDFGTIYFDEKVIVGELLEKMRRGEE